MTAKMTVAENIALELPLAMRMARRWIVWKSIPVPGKKERKIPCYVDGTQRFGAMDTEQDMARLSTFDQAMSVITQSTGYAGVGFALGPDGTGKFWQGIDLDNTAGRPELAALVDLLPGYIEWSPSEKGVHAIGLGRDFTALGSNHSGIEAYCGKRFFTVTGNAIGGDIADLSAFVNGTLATLHHDGSTVVNTASIAVTPDTVRDLRSALFHMRSDDRDLWVRLGHALKTLGDTGRGLWLDWSATSDKFDSVDAARVWESLQPKATDHRAVFSTARKAGWVASRNRPVRPEPEPQREEQDWMADLISRVRDDGVRLPLSRVHNFILILTHSEEFKGRIRYNEFSDTVSIDDNDIDDVAAIRIKAIFERAWISDKVTTADVMDALHVVSRRESYHPIRDYLTRLKWDGIERIPSFFEDHCGTARDEYHMAVANSLFVSAVARVLNPGCKVDTMVILQSPQGRGKTKLWSVLFGDWCSEVTANLSDKDFYTGLRGVWCADFAELDAFSKAEATQIKRVITSQCDTYRPHYGRTSKRFPRQCIFVGGSNRDDWHTDPTGGRRFLPVNVRMMIDTNCVANIRDQLWAEAVVRYRRGDTWWDIPHAETHQAETYQGDPWEDPINQFAVGRPSVSIASILTDCLRIETGRQTRADQMRVSATLKRSGFERKRTVSGWIYVPKKE